MKFHQKREENPAKFSSRTGNMVIYAMLGVEKAILPSSLLEDNVTITTRTFPNPSGGNALDANVQKVPVHHARVQSDWEGVVISNLPNYQVRACLGRRGEGGGSGPQAGARRPGTSPPPFWLWVSRRGEEEC